MWKFDQVIGFSYDLGPNCTFPEWGGFLGQDFYTVNGGQWEFEPGFPPPPPGALYGFISINIKLLGLLMFS